MDGGLAGEERRLIHLDFTGRYGPLLGNGVDPCIS